MRSLMRTWQFELVTCIILCTYFSIFGIYAMVTTEHNLLIPFYWVLYPLAVLAMVGSTIYNMFKQFYDRRAEARRNHNGDVQWDPCLWLILFLLFPTIISIPLFRVTKPHEKNPCWFVWWNLPGMSFLFHIIFWPYILEKDREYWFYILMFLSNYILIYTVLYNIFTFAGKKYISNIFNPISYFFLVFCFPIFWFMVNYFENRKARKYAMEQAKKEEEKRLKEEAELYGVRTIQQMVIELNSYVEDRDI